MTKKQIISDLHHIFLLDLNTDFDTTRELMEQYMIFHGIRFDEGENEDGEILDAESTKEYFFERINAVLYTAYSNFEALCFGCLDCSALNNKIIYEKY